MISQVFLLSSRGDTIIFRDYRNDLLQTTPEIFYRQVRLHKGDAPPIFNLDGVNYCFIKKNGIYIVATCRFNSSPSTLIEVLQRIGKVIKDFCGVISEESVRKNFILVYEILEEMLDFGYPQLMQTEQIKLHIANQPIILQENNTFQNVFQKSQISSKAAQRSVQEKNKGKNEIFADIFEKISVLFNSSGTILNSTVDGCIQMKSFLIGNPPLKLALNEDLVIGKSSFNNAYIDDCNFHECVNTNEFETNKILRISPPDGEFTLMNYRVTGEFQVPFRIFPYVDESQPFSQELTLKIKNMIPNKSFASYVVAKFQIPKFCQNVHTEIDKKQIQFQKVDYNEKQKYVEWTIKKFEGQTEQSLKCKITYPTNANLQQARKEIGPINLNFEIPMYNMTNLQIKYLRVESGSQNIFRWVRYITQSNSYICRV